MRHARNRSPLWRALGVLLCVIIGAILGIAAPDQSAPAEPRHPQSFQVDPLIIKGSRLDKPQPFAAPVLGWRWSGHTVRVYDGTGGKAPWNVPGAVAGWSKASGLDVVLTSDPASAQIVVYEVSQFSVPGYDGSAVGLCIYPSSSGGIATGQARVELAAFWGDLYPTTARHAAIHENGHGIGLGHNDGKQPSVMRSVIKLGDGYSKPQSVDLKNATNIYR